jgi:hypothetical protein
MWHAHVVYLGSLLHFISTKITQRQQQQPSLILKFDRKKYVLNAESISLLTDEQRTLYIQSVKIRKKFFLTGSIIGAVLGAIIGVVLQWTSEKYSLTDKICIAAITFGVSQYLIYKLFSLKTIRVVKYLTTKEQLDKLMQIHDHMSGIFYTSMIVILGCGEL